MRGYSTLIGVILLLAFLTVIILGVHSLNLSNLQSTYNSNSGNSTLRTGESCIEETLRRLKNSLGYTGGSFPISDTVSCSTSISGDNSQKIVTASISEGNFQKTIRATISISIEGSATNFTLINWQEL